MTKKQCITSSYRSQKGVVAVFATLAMAVLIGAGALALDVGNLILSKGKLQNLADTAALSAAKSIDLGSDHAAAISAGNQTIADNLALNGFNALTVDSSSISYDFSETLPFNPATSTATSPYVRIRIENVDIPDFLVTIFNIDMSVRASAVAGPSTKVASTCNIVPISICEGDEDPNTISGYKRDTLHVLKASSSQDSSIGAGNFMPMALQDAAGNPISGANSYKEALAGSFDACLSVVEDEPITSEPGNMVGPTDGIDTRFGLYSGSMKKDQDRYPADKITDYRGPAQVETVQKTEPDPDNPDKRIPVFNEDGSPVNIYQPTLPLDDVYSYETYNQQYIEQEFAENDYKTCIGDSACQASGYYRRIISVPILKCDKITKTGGRMDIPLKGLGCFFLTQPSSVTTHVDSNGGDGGGSWIIGQFLEKCPVNASKASNIPSEIGPYKIQLYKDPDSEDS
ncbi:Tad domain-containing protein [Photobacterium lipolyticum]|uniref:Putative Flp pilus-assembly TadG-like N-terminal domain-containing protein n=1 Tax=Photobacterium lipolyticum TaxID=266810 RepID=A0A2T3MYX0_9GAMM|nr:Tad domain-containing protein [Photobacterium lipolyticum]PSW05151.1 hypothetical protein C9I89_10190 [Photobacterium lipolyticum]